MKGISQTLYLIVAAVVLIVVALVLLTIFGGGMQPAIRLTEARNICETERSVICSATGNLPPTWSAATKFTDHNEDGTPEWESCFVITGQSSCPT